MIMPGQANGLDVAQHCLLTRPDLKVIYTSGYSSELFASNVKLKDGVNYLPKPYLSGKLASIIQGALRDAKTVGADTVLLVPGVVNKDVTYEQCFERSQAEVKKALPLAEKLKVPIAIEVVWNNFITKPEQLIEYVDSFKSEYVGAYFDCSNMIKYGVPPADWIRKLGKRMLKFDFKGYSKKKQWVENGHLLRVESQS